MRLKLMRLKLMRLKLMGLKLMRLKLMRPKLMRLKLMRLKLMRPKLMYPQVRETVTTTTSVPASWSVGLTTASPSQAASGTKAELGTDEIRDNNRYLAITLT